MNTPVSHQPYQKLMTNIILIVGSMLYGTLGYFGVNLFHEELSVSAMLGWRFFTAGMALLVIILWRDGINAAFNRTLFNHDLRTIQNMLCYAGGSLFYFIGVQYTGTAIAMVIFFTFPLFVTLHLIYIGEAKLNHFITGSLLCILLGMKLLEGEGTLNFTGVGYALLAAISYAIYILANRGHKQEQDPLYLGYIVCLSNGLFFLLISALNHSFALPHNAIQWTNVLCIGILSTAAPVYLTLIGLKRASAINASIMTVFEPLVTMLLAIALLHEHLNVQQLAGALFMLLAAVMIQFA